MERDASRIRVRGRQLLQTTYVALQTLKLYPPENEAAQNALTELHNAVCGILQDEGALEIRLAGDFFFINDVRIRVDVSNYASVRFVAQAFQRHGIGVAEIAPGVERSEWAPLLLLLAARGAATDAFERFTAEMAASPVRHIDVRPAREVEAAEHADVRREAAKRTYFQTVRVARELLTSVRAGKPANLRGLKRAVQEIVDQVLKNRTTLVGMIALREFDEYAFTHPVNVSILSVAIGQELGLNRWQLYTLGLGALLHDIGKTRLAPDLAARPGRMAPTQREVLETHPREGLVALGELSGFAEPPFRPMLVTYEHHRTCDGGGYPPARRHRGLAPLSRIVAVADAFDAATSARSYRFAGEAPDRVLRRMLDEPGWGLDPRFVKALIRVIGLCPVGTLVVLNTREVAVVLDGSGAPEHAYRPAVLVLTDSEGAPRAEPFEVALSETHAPARAILRTLDAQHYQVSVGQYFL